MAIILALLCAIQSVWALTPGERVAKTQILKILPDNIIQLNRGFEDGLSFKSHVKIIHPSEGFIARAICLKSSANTSYWRLYRIPNAQALSADLNYTLISIDQLLAPPKVLENLTFP